MRKIYSKMTVNKHFSDWVKKRHIRRRKIDYEYIVTRARLKNHTHLRFFRQNSAFMIFSLFFSHNSFLSYFSFFWRSVKNYHGPKWNFKISKRLFPIIKKHTDHQRRSESCNSNYMYRLLNVFLSRSTWKKRKSTKMEL